MRRFVILPVLLAGAVACNADAREESAVPGTGSGTARDYAVGDFGAVSLAGSQNVIVTVGGEPSVRAEGSEEALERLEILVENGTLKIRTRNRSGIGWSRSAGPVTVHVSAPRISAASIGGSGDMRIDRVEADRLNASVAGSGNLTIDAIRVGAGNFSIAGSGNIRAAGGANNAEVSIAGSGDADLSGLQSRTATISVVGSGDVRLSATETASVSILGSGDVTVSGGARCSVSKRGSGDVRCG